jgi:hypothetical protein
MDEQHETRKRRCCASFATPSQSALTMHQCSAIGDSEDPWSTGFPGVAATWPAHRLSRKLELLICLTSIFSGLRYAYLTCKKWAVQMPENCIIMWGTDYGVTDLVDHS